MRPEREKRDGSERLYNCRQTGRQKGWVSERGRERCRPIKRVETVNTLTHLPNKPPARRRGRKGAGQRRQGRGVVSRGAATQASLKQASCTGRRRELVRPGLYLIYRLSEKGKLLSVVPRHNYHNLRAQYHIYVTFNCPNRKPWLQVSGRIRTVRKLKRTLPA